MHRVRVNFPKPCIPLATYKGLLNLAMLPSCVMRCGYTQRCKPLANKTKQMGKLSDPNRDFCSTQLKPATPSKGKLRTLVLAPGSSHIERLRAYTYRNPNSPRRLRTKSFGTTRLFLFPFLSSIYFVFFFFASAKVAKSGHKFSCVGELVPLHPLCNTRDSHPRLRVLCAPPSDYRAT
jgi:hypothetical protein